MWLQRCGAPACVAATLWRCVWLQRCGAPARMVAALRVANSVAALQHYSTRCYDATTRVVVALQLATTLGRCNSHVFF
jgi:hypothetical protein